MMTRADRFLKACRREPVDCTPVWFMRQAGRYLAEYRALRQQYPLVTLCKTPELAVQVTLQPLARLAVDAAIIFTDLLIPVQPMGMQLEFIEAEGPVIQNPIRRRSDVEALRVIDPETELDFTLEAIRLTCRALGGKVPLIGFAGAPFTVASYLIEGSGSRQYLRTKALMYHEPQAWHLLLDKLARVTTAFLRAQIRAGAQAVQLFDSWVGCLAPEDYRVYVLPHSRHVIEGLQGTGVPVIHFGTGTATLLGLMRDAGGDVMGVDWRIALDDAWREIGPDMAIQGNLDPAVLFAPLPEIEPRVAAILDRAGNRPGHIFNLGHGILPETPVDHVAAVVEMVHTQSARSRAEDSR